MAGLGTAVAFLLLLWCSLLYVPFRWRPVGIYLITWKALAVPVVWVMQARTLSVLKRNIEQVAAAPTPPVAEAASAGRR
jgi:hypothetical protein